MPDVSTLDQAKTCIENGVPQPADLFIKSLDFRGILVAKCSSVSHRDQLITTISDIARKGDLKTWAKIHHPIDVHTADGVLFAFKRFLIAWGYDKRHIRIDTAQHSIKV